MVVKIVIALIIALILIWLSGRWLKKNTCADRILRSLPGNLVQEIADRLTELPELLAFLSEFFKTPYAGEEHPVQNREELSSLLTPLDVPAEEQEDLLKVLGSIEPDALLAYAVSLPDHSDQPAVITVCRAPDTDNKVLVGIFKPAV